jgi:hypothetical protein
MELWLIPVMSFAVVFIAVPILAVIVQIIADLLG